MGIANLNISRGNRRGRGRSAMRRSNAVSRQTSYVAQNNSRFSRGHNRYQSRRTYNNYGNRNFNNNSNGRCFVCHQFGHFANFCPFTSNNNGRGRAPLRRGRFGVGRNNFRGRANALHVADSAQGSMPSHSANYAHAPSTGHSSQSAGNFSYGPNQQ